MVVNSSIELVLRGIPVTVKKLAPQKYDVSIDNSKLTEFGKTDENLERICNEVVNYLKSEGFI